MKSSNRPRALNISKQDMEASRLVFVSLKGSKPRRKVAVPVPDSYTYEQFADKIKQKLKLLSVGAIYHVSTGEQLTNIDDLQDIDELLVEEAPEEPIENGTSTHGTSDAALRSDAATTSADSILGGPDRTSSSTATPSAAMLRSHQPGRAGPPPASSIAIPDDDEDTKKKYMKRNTGVMRKLQRMFPSLLGPGLPVTTRDVDGGGGSKRKRGRSLVDPRNFLILFALLSCLATMLLLYSRVSV
mmetsp:Transcript_15648/g.43769  ORF Transcript_15648/g.43769 Transcript_15648/m.43769 type:complete len:243 (-) Transcript_15648:415-1143(-)|eukprot:CAMPEP_0117651868 /NCGR_PEP_ID=MMETSP0804-20121206/2323_1 /TAXON_ID=1074897 /ORGANISM="Tetraselmis astigmatica, Strain CCMP880" /LENGTH=242 /DNA_ID=CAMNT_0005457877 /DNA_START=126 /DNA_END=854 /DNA_ORIENTATION=-